MASEPKKKRFREPEAGETSIENIKKAIPRSTLYKNRWGVRIFEAWQAERQNKLVMSEDNPFALDLTQVENLDTSLRNMSMKSMNFWLINYITTICRIVLMLNLNPVFRNYFQIQCIWKQGCQIAE